MLDVIARPEAEEGCRAEVVGGRLPHEERDVRALLPVVEVALPTGEASDVAFCDSQWNSSGLMA